MSARTENLYERLRAVCAEIETREAAGTPSEELNAERAKLESDLRQARTLLTEGSEAKVLRG